MHADELNLGISARFSDNLSPYRHMSVQRLCQLLDDYNSCSKKNGPNHSPRLSDCFTHSFHCIFPPDVLHVI